MKRKHIIKIVIVAVVVVLIAVFRIVNIEESLFVHLKASQNEFEMLYSENRLAVIAAYIMMYIFLTSLSLPVAAVMTIAGGALFGLVAGTIVVSFASTTGATLACFVSRFLMREWVQGKFGDKLKTVNEGIEKEGAFYLFTLRLIPVFPFWLINLVMGLTRMPLRTFYWVSQVGMLPGTIVYVNAGKELAKIESLSGIMSPGLVLSFALLGLFPLAARKSIAAYKSKKGVRESRG